MTATSGENNVQYKEINKKVNLIVFFFKFEDYDELLAEAWKWPMAECDPLTRLDLMLRELVRRLQSWSDTTIG